MRDNHIDTSYTMLSSDIPWNIPVFISIFSVYLILAKGEWVYQENTSEKWDIPQYTMRKYCLTILYHATATTVTNTITAMHNGEVECTKALLFSDGLSFLWHGVKYSIRDSQIR